MKLINAFNKMLQMFVLTAVLIPSLTHAEDELHAPFTSLLEKYVSPINPIDAPTSKTFDFKGTSTEVDYAGFKSSQEALKVYLKSLAGVSQQTFDQWDKASQLAFLINAYNAYTIDLILTRYPEISSIRDIGSFFSSPWKKEFAMLLGEKRSLDNIEHGLIREEGVYSEPRIHFAVNCASIGCPALREEAYLGSQLDEQLEQQTLRFLSDKSRNYAKENTLYVSKIFDWYTEDFAMQWRGSSSLSGFLAQYEDALSLSESHVKLLKEESSNIKFLDYNWALNDKQ